MSKKQKKQRKSDEIRENIENGYYEPDRPYPPPPIKPRLQMDHTSIDVVQYANDLNIYELEMEFYKKKLLLYRSEKHRLENEFKEDAIADCGLQKNKGRHRAFNMAQDRGSSAGLESVLGELEELTVLLDIAGDGF